MSYVKLGSLPLRIWGLASREEGQTLTEVTLIIAFVALLCVGLLSALGFSVLGFFSPVADAFG